MQCNVCTGVRIFIFLFLLVPVSSTLAPDYSLFSVAEERRRRRRFAGNVPADSISFVIVAAGDESAAVLGKYSESELSTGETVSSVSTSTNIPSTMRTDFDFPRFTLALKFQHFKFFTYVARFNKVKQKESFTMFSVVLT